MKILLAMNLPYFGDPGFNNGATKANRYLLEGLAASGHRVIAVVPTLEAAKSRLNEVEYLTGLAAQGVTVSKTGSLYTYLLNGVEVHAVGEMAGLRPHLSEQIVQFAPDWVLVSCEDWAQGLLELALKSCPGRVVYLCLSPTYLPFGPQAFVPNDFTTELLGQTAAIVAGSRFIERYIRQWSGLEAAMFYWPSYEPGPFPRFGRFDGGFVTMINPCDVKGIDIFLDLARHFSQIDFAVVPTWGTTAEDRAALAQLPNVHLLKAVENIDEIFERTRILLMPTLFPEGVGLTTVEAMLRGIPVLASDVGALPEMKLGVDFLLPVQPIEQFSDDFDPNLIPKPVVPEQDSGPWLVALERLLTDRAFYEELSETSRTRALEFVGSLSVEPFERLLENLEAQAAAVPVASALGEQQVLEELGELSPEQQELLLLWMSQQEVDSPGEDSSTNGAEPPLVSWKRTALKSALVEIWEALLPGRRVTLESDFFALGGNAVLLEELLERVARQVGQPVSPDALPSGRLTIADLAEAISHQTSLLGTMLNHRKSEQMQSQEQPLLVHLRPTGERPPLFFAAPLGGTFASTVVIGLLDLARQLPPGQPFYGLQAPALATGDEQQAEFSYLATRLEAIVEASVRQIQAVQPAGPYYLGGFCSGGLLAMEIAQSLRRQNQAVANVVLLDPLLPETPAPSADEARQDWEAASLAWFAGRDLGESGWDVAELYRLLSALPEPERWPYLCAKVKAAALVPADTTPAELEWLWQAKRTNEQIVARLVGNYPPRFYTGPVTILVSEQMGRTNSDALLDELRHFLRGPLQVQAIQGDHGTLFLPQYLQALADSIYNSLSFPTSNRSWTSNSSPT